MEDKEEMIDILQSFVDIAEPQLYKYENLVDDVKSTKWALSYIEQLENKVKELEEYKKISELTKISCCMAQNCGALNNAIREGLENDKLKKERQAVIDKLKERRKQNNTKYGQSIDENEFPEMYEYGAYVKEDDYILNMLEGGKNEQRN